MQNITQTRAVFNKLKGLLILPTLILFAVGTQ